jgi:hypothetical protein
MSGIDIKTIKDQVIIMIDSSLINIDFLNNLYSRVRVEELVKKAKFDDKVVKIGEEIKGEWWRKNRIKYLPKVK